MSSERNEPKFEFYRSYHRAINLILFDLLTYIHYNIDYQKDREFLRSEVFRLLTVLNLETPTLSILDELNRIAYDTLKNVKPTATTKLNKINVDSADDIIRTIEKYKSKFLKERYEKSH